MIPWDAMKAYATKYVWVVVLALVTALVYVSSNIIIQVAAELHPSIKIITITKTYEHRNLQVVEKTVYDHGVTETSRTTLDRSELSTEASGQAVKAPVLATTQGGGASRGTVWLGVGRGLDPTYHASLGYSYGTWLLQVDNPVYSSAENAVPRDYFKPRVTASFGYSF